VLPLKDNIPTRRFPILTVAIIVACTIVYFGFEQGGIGLGDYGNKQVVKYGAIPYEVSHPGKECGRDATGQQVVCQGQTGVVGKPPDQPPWWATVFSSMFMHGSILHLAGNMLFLWIFGNNIEDSMGRPRFLGFYLLGGLAALAAQVAVDSDAAVPTVGASGAIAAVLGGYALLYPRARVVTIVFIILFFTILELPALVVLGLWFLIQLFYGAADLSQPVGSGGGGVAYFAHIGGFVFGLLLIKLFANRVHDDYDLRHRMPVY
jgi:membrane associated rhomboid family serine protease